MAKKRKLSARKKAERRKVVERKRRSDLKPWIHEVNNWKKFLKLTLLKQDFEFSMNISTRLSQAPILKKRLNPYNSKTKRVNYVWYQKLLAAASHFFLRCHFNKCKRIPFQLLQLRNINIFRNKEALQISRYKKKTEALRKIRQLKKYRERKRTNYKENILIKEAKKSKCRDRYQTLPLFRMRESTRNRVKYRIDVDVKKRESTRSRLRYQNNEEVKERESRRMRTRYQERLEVRENQKEAKRKRYQEIPETSEKIRALSRRRYHENEEVKITKTKKKRERYHKTPEVKKRENQRQRLSYRKNSPLRERKQQQCRIKYQRNVEIRQRESLRNKEVYQNIPKRRKTILADANERYSKIKEQKNNSLVQHMNAYLKKIVEGPTHVCVCCGGLFYREAMRIMEYEEMIDDYGDIICKVLCVDVDEPYHQFCSTCFSYIRRNKIPRYALSNGLAFPPIPPELQELTALEHRLIAPRIPFMQIRALGVEKQWGLYSNVVNVENNIDICINALPRDFNQASVTQIKFKRRLSYPSHDWYEKVRPQKVVKALSYLLQTPMYKKYQIKLNENWEHYKSQEVDFIVDPNDAIENEKDDDTTEHLDDMEEITGADESLFFTNAGFPYLNFDSTPDPKDPKEVHIAPGEGKTPIPMYKDLDAEHLSFPAIYCGQMPSLNPHAKLSYGDVAKSELRRYDRRCATPEKILYCFKKLYVKRVRDAFQVCLRQKKRGCGSDRLTAKKIRDPEFLTRTIDKDDGYTVYKHVRSTPSFWMDQQKRLVSMVRQLGTCTFFITLSAAETKWNELLVMLMKNVRGLDITESDAEMLDSDTKYKLIREDPVTCSRHFDHRLRALKTELIVAKNGVFGEDGITDYFWRIEYQMRGSPHCHGVYWTESAPKYTGDAESSRTVIEFVDQHVTCKRDEEGDMARLIEYQNHRHSQSCYKTARAVRKCRFHYPKPPLPETMILLPLSKDLSPKDRAKATSDYTIIEQKLNKMGRSFKDIIPFQLFLEELNLTREQYVHAIRSTIRSATIFLRRETNAAFINNYNKDILLAWKANMDIQFVLDPYACAKYCVGYMMKAEGGLSKLLRKAQEEGKTVSTKERLQKFGSILLSGSEISAQEAVGFVLGLPNTDSSRSHVYVNTNRIGGRIGILRPKEELDQLDEDSEDICVKGLLDHYSKRADEMNNVCLAEFACSYTFKRKGETEQEETTSKRKNAAKKIWLKDRSGYVIKRGKAKILRYRHFSKITDPVEYYREQLMLFFPWRDEEKELDELADTHAKYLQHLDAINDNSKEYYYDKLFDEDRLREIISEEQIEAEDEEVVTNQLERFEDERCAMAELSAGPEKSAAIATLRPPQIMSYEDFSKTMRSLNLNQRRIVNEVLHRVKTGKHPFYIFLTGGAGVGKSHVITAIVQGIMHYMFFRPGNPEDIPVLVTAPTGKAAFNVNGITMHSAFKLPANQSRGEAFQKMDYSHANTYRLKYAATKLFIIDEISMTSSIQFDQIDNRFQQMFLNPTQVVDFAGKSILAVGDFRQLPPIPPKYIFKSPDKGKDRIVPNNPKWTKFEYFELDQIMRQKGEYEFCKALNAMARGTMDEEDIALMRSREITKTCFPPSEAVHLYLWNQDCAEYNQRYHEGLKSQGAVSIAHDTISGPGSRSQKEFDLERAKSFKRQITDGIPYEVVLKVGGLYMVTTNINVSDGLFNGATGLLKHIEFASSTSGERIPTVAWLEFSNILVGHETRKNYRTYQRPIDVPKHCVPIERYRRSCRGAPKHIHNCELVRYQIPLIPANALTICKAQGSSLPKVVVNTKIRKLDRPNLYVACSRATSKSGLWIDGKFCPPNPPSENDPVIVELDRLKQNPVTFSQLFPVLMTNYKWKVYFQNIHSFLKHQPDLEADQNVIACDLVAFVEPHVYSNKDPKLNGFHRVNFIPCHGKAPGDSQGSLIFSKEEQIQNTITNISNKKQRTHYLITGLRLGKTSILVCYKHPDFSKAEFLEELDQQISMLLPGRLVVLGDININIIGSKDHQVHELMHKHHLTSRLGELETTTDHGTQIDVCFSNIDSLISSTYETYFSDHRGICACFNE